MEFWNEIAIDRSFRILLELRKIIIFVLLGGWAVYFFTNAIKSKDIDMIVDFENLSKIKSELEIQKTEFLKRYEGKVEGTSIDIYVPYYSEFAVPAEEIVKNTVIMENLSSETRDFADIEAAGRDSEEGQREMTEG